MHPILVTGAAGFIGFCLSRRLLEQGFSVVGLDNLNDYYDVSLKESRLAELTRFPRFAFQKIDIAHKDDVAQLFADARPASVVHLAAQAGVRHSLRDPHAYGQSNLTGFLNILEACRHAGVGHLVFASSSSVYGGNRKLPFSVQDRVDHPLSLYAATKKANELMAHAYSSMFGLPVTGLRFFTVYGPWGRPDMAIFSFTRDILAGQPIKVFNHGNMRRDFTYIDDVIEGLVRVLDHVPTTTASPGAPDLHHPAVSSAPYRIYNIGNNRPVELLRLIHILEQNLGRKAHIEFLPMQPGDMQETYADIDDLVHATGFQPSTPLEVGIERFVDWYLSYYSLAPARTKAA